MLAPAQRSAQRAVRGSQPYRIDLVSGRRLVIGDRTLIMGVVNTTPDSFSDGGRFLDPDRAVEHGLQLLDDGADVLDIGGESTRPGGGVYGDGAEPVSREIEIDRVRPVIEALRRQTDAPLSVDTRWANVARVALDCGADLVNDVSALGDPGMAALLVEYDAPVILMHSRGQLRTMQTDIRFDSVVLEVRRELEAAAVRAQDAGIRPTQLLLDPGIGFGKTVGQNLSLLREIGALAATGRPIVVGTSRKSFLRGAKDTGPDARLGGSLATALWAARSGADVLRVHDVLETVQLLEVWGRLQDGGVQDGGDHA